MLDTWSEQRGQTTAVAARQADAVAQETRQYTDGAAVLRGAAEPGAR